MSESEAVLDVLVTNARESATDIARQTGLTEAEVEARIEELEAAGVVRGYGAVVDWSRTDDERVRAMVELNVELDRETGYDDIAGRISKFPEVTSLRLVSGEYDFAVEIEAASMNAVSQVVSEQVAPIPEVTNTVTHYVMETYKDRGVEFADGDDDDRLSVSP